MELYSLDGVFERRVLRIPDYQRGYAWQEQQIKDFWEDIYHLAADKVHYTGVVTLEPVPEATWNRWDQDKWIIDGRGYRPFYVVDGQQRLTTSIILIQAIIERIDSQNKDLPEGEKISLDYQTLEEIKRKYIVQEAADGFQKSYLFGYEKDNPSDEFLRTSIFGETSSSDSRQKTLYTRNLRMAKNFFAKELKEMEVAAIATLFKKLTQKIKLNLYEIDDELDVFVTFETMNNRGKPLSNLELLKNRLIYLSTLFEDHAAGKELRVRINNVWKTIYEYLGKRAKHPLNDDDFLRNHWIIYFKYNRGKEDAYAKFLLEEKFIARKITHPKEEESSLTMEEIDKYVENLRQSIRPWFYMHEPRHSDMSEYMDKDNKILLDQLHRLTFGAFRPLLLASYVSERKVGDINLLLAAVERYNFTLFTLCKRRSNTGDSLFYGLAREILMEDKPIPAVISEINKLIVEYYDPNLFLNHISEMYKIRDKGFYGWNGLRYFLYEYEQTLQLRAKLATEQLSWHPKDHVSVEHILPQTASDPYWKKLFNKYSPTKKQYLTHSLGNLLPLSIARNSSLQNDSFPLKKDNGRGVGYQYGSLSDNEVAMNEDWDAVAILQRGLKLLKFMEERWDIKLGDDEFKRKLLHLDFLTDESNG